LLLLIVALFSSCSESNKENKALVQFTKLSSDQTGLDFNNTIQELEDMNYFVHSGFYNGAGLATGDLNNDGLVDLFFSGNQVQNELFLNKGDLEFENFTRSSGIEEEGWFTGATMVDINNDGYLDIYVCRYFSPDNQLPTSNLLYVNNGDLTFSEVAEEYGIADSGNSVQATFLDYDLDGDLDLYVLNQPTGFRAEKESLIAPNNWKDSDRLYRNEGDKGFVDVTEEAGILNFAYGLCAVVGDLNKDGYPDVFISNDYEAPDHLYLNNQKGGFDRIEDYVFKHLSNYSMGADIADFNNDGWLDIFVADMLADQHYRQKANMGAMNEKKFNSMVESGMHYQYMRNMLHLNNKLGSFSEIGQLAGVSKTDWSWAPLFADFNNDGWLDLFVTNGILRDVRNNDAQQLTVENTLAHTKSFPSQPISNVMFKNSRDLRFENAGKNWGLSDAGFSNGAVYADLDNDGDLDLITNNINSEAGIYRNNNPENGSWLQVKLEGQPLNPRGRGAKVTVFRDKDQLHRENTIERGYMSGLSGIMHFGLGEDYDIDKVEVVWPNGKKQTIPSPESNRRLVVKQQDATEDWFLPEMPNPLFISRNTALGIDRKHEENQFNDFDKQILLPHKMSTFGPGIAVGDVNADGADDFYIGGAANQPGALYMKADDGTFNRHSVASFEDDKSFEDMGVLFIDIDADTDLDLYVVSGGNCYTEASDELNDRIYLNDGAGNFKRDKNRLPDMRSSGSCVIATDFDSDGDPDLFVGGKHRPGNYPLSPRSYLLENDGGTFKDVTEEKAPGLQRIGMVSSALWSDVDNDGQTDLIVVGEWMPIVIFKNSNGNFTRLDEDPVLATNTGWWNSIIGGDFDKDGDLDYVVGNQGLNTKFHVSQESPLDLYSLDFDNNEALDIILATSDSGMAFPVRGRECSAQQIPEIEKKFEDYHSFASATLEDIYSIEKLDQASHFQATTFASSFIRNNQEAGFEVIPLPIEAQFSSVFGMIANDFNLDGNLDVLLTGNFYAPEVETGRQDAGTGVLLNGDGQGGFECQDSYETGFQSLNDARSMALLYDGIFPLILVGNNNDELEAFTYINATGKGDQFQPGEIYAEKHFKDGRVQRFENYLGSGYLSVSNGFIQIGPHTEKLVFYKSDGTMRILNFGITR
jgi:hypothetical protein